MGESKVGVVIWGSFIYPFTMLHSRERSKVRPVIRESKTENGGGIFPEQTPIPDVTANGGQ